MFKHKSPRGQTAIADWTSTRRIAAEISGHAIEVNVASEADWPRTIAETVATFGGLDVLVSCAGIELVRSLSETSFEDWRRIMSVNLDGVFLGNRSTIAVMPRGGSMVNISSVAGINGFSRQVAYCASKGGVRLLSKAAAVEGAKAGLSIRVNSMHPGIIDTPMAQDILGTVEPQMRPEIEARWRLLHPVGRIGQASEVAQCILFLASDVSSFVPGIELVADRTLTHSTPDCGGRR